MAEADNTIYSTFSPRFFHLTKPEYVEKIKTEGLLAQNTETRPQKGIWFYEEDPTDSLGHWGGFNALDIVSITLTLGRFALFCIDPAGIAEFNIDSWYRCKGVRAYYTTQPRIDPCYLVFCGYGSAERRLKMQSVDPIRIAQMSHLLLKMLNEKVSRKQWNNAKNAGLLQSFLEVTEYKSACHSLEHANNVELLSLMLAKKTDADRDVIIWFAYLHDSLRTDDRQDNNHGPVAAMFVDIIRNTYLQYLNDTQIWQLKEACRLHTSTRRTGDITIDTCFDADRLDYWRFGTQPEPKRMATEWGAKYAVNHQEMAFALASLL